MQLLESIGTLNWPEIQLDGGNVKLANSNKSLLVTQGDEMNLSFLLRNEDDEGNVTFKSPYSSLENLIFSKDFPVEKILRQDVKLRNYSQLKELFQFDVLSIRTILVSTQEDFYQIDQASHKLIIHPDTLLEIVEEVTSFLAEAGKYYGKFLNYRIREFKRSYLKIEVARKTLSSKGEFSFLVDRFNLETKRAKIDYLKYLNERDVLALQNLSLGLIQKEVFESDFLTKLNDFFIKVRLEEIITLGRQILSLKSTNLTTESAKKVVLKVEPDRRRVKQLETLWQKYFEKYLSFLIFSYQKLHPKVELNVDTQKKYPDFIGINHFGGVDVIEIKTHLKHVLTKDPSHDNYAFSSELSKSIIQTINYMDGLVQEKIKSRSVKEDIKGEILEGNIYRPRGIIIISSTSQLVKGVKSKDLEFQKVIRDFTKLRHGLHNIQILTFDELLNMAENYKDNIVK